MEGDYETPAPTKSPNPSFSGPSQSGCNRLPQPIMSGRPDLTSVQAVFSGAYKMLIKRKDMERFLLDIPFNLCLLLVEKRPAFLIQADGRSASVRRDIDTCLHELRDFFATIHTYQGQLVCLQSRADGIRHAVKEDGSCSCFGRILGYPFAGELDEIHCCAGRFRVNLKISSGDMECDSTHAAASFLAMVGCQNHCVSDVMKMALGFQEVASEISPALRISFVVDLYNDEPRTATCNHLKGLDPPGTTEHHTDCSLGHVAPCHWPSQAGSTCTPQQSSSSSADGIERSRGSHVSKSRRSQPKRIERKGGVREQGAEPCTVTPRDRVGWRMS